MGFKYDGDLIEFRTPPKSQGNPKLTAEQRAENRAIGQIRILGMPGGMKRFNIRSGIAKRTSRMPVAMLRY